MRLAAAVSIVYDADIQVGLVTSGGYGYRLKQSIALAYVRTDLAVPGKVLEIEIFGERRRAIVGREQAAEYGVGLGKDRGQAIASTL